MPRRDQDEIWFFQVGGGSARLSTEMFGGLASGGPAARRFWKPCADITEDVELILVTIELAGVKPEDVSVHLSPQKRTLTVRGKRVQDCDEAENPTRNHQLEVFYGEFERTLDLPDAAIEPEAVTASFSNGILRISIPKRIITPERRSIRITQNNG